MRINPYSLTKIIIMSLALTSLAGAFAYRIYTKLSRTELAKLMHFAGIVLACCTAFALFMIFVLWLEYKARRYDERH